MAPTGNKERISWFLSAGLIMFVTLVVCILVCRDKHVEFCDEAYTYESANSVWKESVYDQWNQWMSGEDISAYYSATDLNPHFITIMKKLWTDHVPLYFWLIRIASLIGYGSSSPWIGMGLNIFLALLFQLWLFYVVGKRYEYDIKKLPVAVMVSVLYFSFPLFFSEVNLIRMYLLLGLELVMLLWYMWCFYSEESKRKETAYILTAACGLITHYLFLPFYGILVFLVFCALLIEKRKRLLRFAGINTAAVILSCILDPYWIWRLFKYNLSPRGSGTGNKQVLGKVLFRALKTLVKEPFGGRLPFIAALIITLLIFGTALFLLIKAEKKDTAVLLSVILVADFIYLAIVYLMNGGEGRYHYPALGIWMIMEYTSAVCCLMGFIRQKGMKGKAMAFPAAAVIVLLFGLNLWCVASDEIDSLNPVSAEDELRERFSDIPWVVYCKEHTWFEECAAYKFMIPSRICFVSPEHMPEGGFELPERIILVTADDKLDEALKHIGMLSGTEAATEGDGVMSGSMGFYPVSL